jgi:hypothetical protein
VDHLTAEIEREKKLREWKIWLGETA